MSVKSVRNITSMIILNITILIAVITIHELGHLLAGELIGCSNAKIVIFDSEQNGPYTELSCGNAKNQEIAYGGSLILTTLFSLSFLSFSNKTQKNMVFVILGFGMLLAGLDVVAITGYELSKYLLMILGTIILIFGEISLGLSYSNND